MRRTHTHAPPGNALLAAALSAIVALGFLAYRAKTVVLSGPGGFAPAFRGWTRGPAAMLSAHDGQAFASLALDPLLSRPFEWTGGSPDMAYRASKPLLGWLVMLTSLGSVHLAAWSLLVWTAVGVGLLAAGAWALSTWWGRRTQWVPLLLLLPGVIGQLLFGGMADGLAAGLALLGMAWWMQKRDRHAIVALCLAALARETSLVVAAALLIPADRARRLKLLVPFGVYAAWIAAVWIRLGAAPTDPQDGRLAIPLAGFLGGVRSWSWVEAVCAATVVVFAAVAFIRAPGPEVRWLVGLSILSAMVFGEAVWKGWDFTRPLLPVTVVGACLLAKARSPPHRGSDSCVHIVHFGGILPSLSRRSLMLVSRTRAALALMVAAAVVLVQPLPASATGEVALASHTPGSTTTTANGESSFAASSADGAYVAFASTATDLVPGQVDGNNGPDVFLYERATGTVTLVSHVPSGGTVTANSVSSYPRLSADGAYVVFYSGADDLVAGQTGQRANLFLFERATGTVSLVSHTAASTTTGAGSVYPIPSMTPDAAYVAFSSTATDLVTGQVDGNGAEDVFVFARATGEITLVSHLPTSAVTTPADGGRNPAISADGGFVAFLSGATDLVDRQRDLRYYSEDVFLFERATGRVTLVSHIPSRESTTADAPSGSPSISADGGFVAFESFATNLVGRRGDGNGTFDIFLYERSTGDVRLVSHTAGSATTTGANSSHSPLLSADGSVVVFTSFAGNLLAGQDDAGDDPDVFLYERASGDVRLVSHTPGSTTTAADHDSCCHTGSHFPSLSANGQFVAFMSTATNLVSGQTDGPFLHTDIFLFERATGTVSLVSHIPRSPTTTADLSSGLRPGGRGPENETPSVSNDGTVAFVSLATDLVTGQKDTNGTIDVFVSPRT